MKSGTDSRLKFKQLKRKLQLPYWQIVGVLESIWRITQVNAPAGDIGKLSDEEIASAIEWDASSTTLIDALVETRWLDRDEEFRLIVHDWSDHAPNHLKGAFKMHDKLFADQIVTRRKGAAKHSAKAPCQGSTPENGATKPSQTKPNLTKPPPREPENGSAGGWDFWDPDSEASVKLRLQSCKFNRSAELIDECREAEITPGQIIAVCDEYLANKEKFTSPGAIAERLRKGSWPVDGVVPVEKAESKKVAKDKAKQAKLVEDLRFKLKKIDNDSRNWDDEKVMSEAKARGLA